MEENCKEKESCENCFYYRQHYSKEKLRFIKINSGHCVRKRIKTNPTLCEYWESEITKKENNNKSLKKVLDMMSERLSKIAAFLNDEET